MPKRRVVITGLGAITPLGLSPDELWQGLIAGKSGAATITSFDTSTFDVHFAAEVKGFNPENWIDPKEVKRLDRFAQMGIVAAVQAVKDANLNFAQLNCERIGVIMGSGVGGFKEYQDQHSRLLEKGPSRVSPFFIPKLMMNSVTGHISIMYGLKGPNFTVASACASANHALGTALRIIQYDDADMVITGGCEAPITVMGLSGFAALKALSTRNDAPEKASRPFEKNRDGFVIGEGGGALIFEELSHAQKRGAPIYAEVLGFGMNADAHHITAPDPEGNGAANCMRLALKEANCSLDKVSYINAHGTSTQLNDATETKAIKKLFGDYAKKIPVSSTKSMIGHLLGAAGGVELVATVLSVKNNMVHPTINYETPDPECDLDYVPNKARAVEVNIAISNTFGFGGHNATIAIGKYRP
jgi:3-oxoacyl-[acyl-carrier-protein] synthase II